MNYRDHHYRNRSLRLRVNSPISLVINREVDKGKLTAVESFGKLTFRA